MNPNDDVNDSDEYLMPDEEEEDLISDGESGIDNEENGIDNEEHGTDNEENGIDNEEHDVGNEEKAEQNGFDAHSDDEVDQLSKDELISRLKSCKHELRVKSNELDSFILEMTRRLSQLNAQLHKDAEELATTRHKDKEITFLKENNGNLSDLLLKKEQAYDLICEEQIKDQNYLMETLTKYEYLLTSLAEAQEKATRNEKTINELKNNLVSLREISVQLQQDKESLRIKLTTKDKQLNRMQLKYNEIKTILDSTVSELETVRQERDDLLSVREEAVENAQLLIEVERQESVSLQLQNNLLKQELENLHKITDKQKSMCVAAEKEILGKARVIDLLDTRLAESLKEERTLASKLQQEYEILENGRREMMELMRKSEKAAEERLDMVITELRRSKGYAESLQNRVTDYELLILSDQSILNELYLTFSKDFLEKESRIPNERLESQQTENIHEVKDHKHTNEMIEAAAAKEVQQRQSLLERKAEILGRRSKELELLKMDSLEGLINKALAEKEKEIDQLNSELLRVEEDSHWLQVRLDLSQKNLSITRKQLEENASLVLILSQERERKITDKLNRQEQLDVAELERMVADLQLSCLAQQKRNKYLMSEIQRLEEDSSIVNQMKSAKINTLTSLEKAGGLPKPHFIPLISIPAPHLHDRPPSATGSRPPANVHPSPSSSPRSPRSSPRGPNAPFSIIHTSLSTPSTTITPPSPKLHSRDPPASTLTRSTSTPNFRDLLYNDPFSLEPSAPELSVMPIPQLFPPSPSLSAELSPTKEQASPIPFLSPLTSPFSSPLSKSSSTPNFAPVSFIGLNQQTLTHESSSAIRTTTVPIPQKSPRLISVSNKSPRSTLFKDITPARSMSPIPALQPLRSTVIPPLVLRQPRQELAIPPTFVANIAPLPPPLSSSLQKEKTSPQMQSNSPPAIHVSRTVTPPSLLGRSQDLVSTSPPSSSPPSPLSSKSTPNYIKTHSELSPRSTSPIISPFIIPSNFVSPSPALLLHSQQARVGAFIPPPIILTTPFESSSPLQHSFERYAPSQSTNNSSPQKNLSPPKLTRTQSTGDIRGDSSFVPLPLQAAKQRILELESSLSLPLKQPSRDNCSRCNDSLDAASKTTCKVCNKYFCVSCMGNINDKCENCASSS